MADPDCAAVFRAAEAGRQGEAVRLFRAMLRERGPGARSACWLRPSPTSWPGTR
ncbi:hypothetical protein [Streptomyces cirratus]|uniref:hypothetical protein n=1 Tax=Streptomyces cirratus TaxID=68187 RepID=UPI0036220409